MPKFVKIVSVQRETKLQQKFETKIAPTQCYEAEKALVFQAAEKAGISVSSWMRQAARNELERQGFDVPPESDYIITGNVAEAAGHYLETEKAQ